MKRPDTHRDDALKATLLALISGGNTPSLQAIVDALTEADWAQFLVIAEQHRLLPMLHDQLRGLALPPDVQQHSKDAFRGAALRNMTLMHALHHLNAMLGAADVPYVALKGARLAWNAYPHPALRPMRDLDILVRPDQAIKTYALLKGQGYQPSDTSAVPLDYALEHHKHLPGLLCPKTQTLIEVHTHLVDRFSTFGPLPEFHNSDALLDRRVWLTVGHAPLPFLPETESLLHLIVHAAYDHRLNNGPLTVSDIAMSLKGGGIDWQHFWALAEEGGWARGAQLLFGLTERFYGPLAIEWGDYALPPLPPEVLDQAALLMLQDHNQRAEVNVRAELAAGGREGGRLGTLLRRLFPPRHKIAEQLGLEVQARWVLLLYPVWLVKMMAQVLRGLSNASLRNEVKRATRVEQWLQGESERASL